MNSGEHILAFIHVAKTGGRTVETMLRSTYGARYVHAEQWIPQDPEQTIQKYRESDFRRLKRLCPFMKAVGGHSVTLWSEIDKVQPVRWFAFMRDPLKRAASHYQFHQRNTPKPKSWEEWLSWDVPRNHQLRAFYPGDDPVEAIAMIKEKRVFIGLLENFDESLVMLKKLVAPELHLGYQRANIAENNEIAAEILSSSEKLSQLRSLHEGEFELYDFVKNELYPSFRQAYGPALDEDVRTFMVNRAQGMNFLNDRVHRASRKFWLGPWGGFYRRKS